MDRVYRLTEKLNLVLVKKELKLVKKIKSSYSTCTDVVMYNNNINISMSCIQPLIMAW